MSDSHDKSDDLIAELAKLMASGASGAGEGAPKPAVIKLPPLNEATIKATPVRIPGMEAPVPAAQPAPADRPVPPVSASPAVRIPGMDRPAGVSDTLPTAPVPRPGSQFDFGRPPPPVSIKSEPLTNWQSHEAAKPAPAPPPPAASGAAAPTGLKIEPVKFHAPEPPPATRAEPKAAAVETAPAPKPEAPAKAASADVFDFNFGFGSGDASPQRHAGQGEDIHDPIADLIAAELLDGGGEEPDEAEPEGDAPPAAVAPQRDTAPQRPVAAPAPHVVQARPAAAMPRQPESDRFTVAPTFNAGVKPSPASEPPLSARPAARADEGRLDPMDEIEDLIGAAVRVELDPPEKPAGQPAPAVPPLNTGFAPRRAGLREKEPEVESAEAAILAAAADVGHVDAPNAEERPYKRMKVKPPRTSGIPSGARQYVGIAVAGTLLLASGFGLYWVLGMGRDDPTTAPVLTADASPVKVEPAAPAVTPEPVSGSVVFDEIDGVASTGENEALVSRDETEGATISEVARAVTPVVTDDDGGVAESGLANRKVRTVTVRPDGTIVSGDDTIAGTAELPVERPNVPEIEGAGTETSDLLTAMAETRAVAAGTAGDAVGEASESLSALVANTLDGASSQLATPDPIEVAALPASPEAAAVFDGSLVAPVPMPRPFDRAGLVGGSRTASLDPAPVNIGVNQPASTPLTAVTSVQQPAAQAPSRAGAYVQLSSQRSEADASASLRSVQSRLGGLLSAPLEIRRVDLGAKGIWYRVVMPTGSFQDATQSCARIKASGGDCVAING